MLVERRLRSERLRQLQAIPPTAAIAPFERSRGDHRLQLVHPAPLALPGPADEFAVAQAIGSVLDGLAWLHAHGAAHGAVAAAALTDGPTGGRLSLAGAFATANATPEGDVYAASALAFEMLVGDAPGRDAPGDPRLEHCASPAVARAIRAGLHDDAAQRPSAALLATMVRGEYLPLLADTDGQDPFFARLHASVRHVLQTQAVRVAAGVGAAIVVVTLVAALSSADQADTTPTALRSLAEEPVPAAKVLSVIVTQGRASSTTAAPASVAPTVPEVTTTTSTTRPAPPPIVVPVSAAAPDAQPRPTVTVAPPPPPPPTTISPTSTAPTTSVTTIRAPTTTAVKPVKGKGPKADR
ncbi:MAG: hypothetical protein ABI658_07165 [Acidimicrobiales bacterium]